MDKLVLGLCVVTSVYPFVLMYVTAVNAESASSVINSTPFYLSLPLTQSIAPLKYVDVIYNPRLNSTIRNLVSYSFLRLISLTSYVL